MRVVKIIQLWISVSNQDRVTSTKYICSPETIKILGKLHGRNHIQVTEQQSAKDSDPWDMGNKQAETYNCPAYCMQKVSKQWLKKGIPGRGWWASSVEKTAANLEKTR